MAKKAKCGMKLKEEKRGKREKNALYPKKAYESLYIVGVQVPLVSRSRVHE